MLNKRTRIWKTVGTLQNLKDIFLLDTIDLFLTFRIATVGFYCLILRNLEMGGW
jgi:hypothetical protein